MKNLIFVIIILFYIGTAAGQIDQQLPHWKYVTGKEDIKVYQRTVPDSKIKALKAECVLNATMDEVISLILDIPSTSKWVCNAKSCVLLRKISDRELYYYTEVSLPWPIDNRDFVTHLSISEDPVTKVVTVKAPAVPGLMPDKKGKVRVRNSVNNWTLTPSNDRVSVEYQLQVDPGGAIPAHVVNMFASQGPIETFTKMKEQLKLRKLAKSSHK